MAQAIRQREPKDEFTIPRPAYHEFSSPDAIITPAKGAFVNYIIDVKAFGTLGSENEATRTFRLYSDDIHMKPVSDWDWRLVSGKKRHIESHKVISVIDRVFLTFVTLAAVLFAVSGIVELFATSPLVVLGGIVLIGSVVFLLVGLLRNLH